MGINHMSDWTSDEYSLISGKTNSYFINNPRIAFSAGSPEIHTF